MTPPAACIGALATPSLPILGTTLAVGMVLGALLFRRFARGRNSGLVDQAGELGHRHGVAGSARPTAAARNNPQVIAAAKRRPACNGDSRGSLVFPWRAGRNRAKGARLTTTPGAPGSR